MPRSVPRLCDHLDIAAAVLRQRPVGVIVDVDGTISPIAPTPEEATVNERCRAALGELVGRLDLVAAISGRPAAVAREMVGLDGVVYLGNHGLERWQQGSTTLVSTAAPYQPAVTGALAALRERLTLPGLVFEDKGIVAAVHYRMCDDRDEARAVVLDTALQVAKARGLRVAEGKRVVELRPPVARDKGTAVADLVAEFRLGGALYVGDDRTDVAAFQRLRRIRRAGACSAFGIAVLEAESPPEVRRAADYAVEGVVGVCEMLEWIVGLSL